MSPHRPIEIELPDHLSTFGAVVALLRAVRDATLVRGTLTPPEINAAADELLKWIENHQQRAAAAVAAAMPTLLTIEPGLTENDLAVWLREAGEYPRAGTITMGLDYGFIPVDRAPPVDEPVQP
jgi:hypothetical protein